MSAVTINQFNAFKNDIMEQINVMENKLSSIQDNMRFAKSCYTSQARSTQQEIAVCS
jgi:hypothetical protein